MGRLFAFPKIMWHMERRSKNEGAKKEMEKVLGGKLFKNIFSLHVFF